MFTLSQTDARNAVRSRSALRDLYNRTVLKTDEKLTINDGFLFGFPDKCLIQDAPWVQFQMFLLVSKINPKKCASSNRCITANKNNYPKSFQ